MEITKENIIAAIKKMVVAGKQMPQRDRIRNSKDPAGEQEKVMAETVALWWEMFRDRHIGVERWTKATERAIMLNSIPRLDVSIISPTLMAVALEKVEAEYLQEQEAKHQREKEAEPYKSVVFPEGFRLAAYHMKHHKKPMPFPSIEEAKAYGRKVGLPEDVISKNVIQLRVYGTFLQHSARNGVNCPIKPVLEAGGHISLKFK